MKKLLLLIPFILCLSLRAEVETITIPVGTNQITTGVTDATKGTATVLPQSGLGMVRMNFLAYGNTLTTNGTITVYLETAQSKTGPWDFYTNTNIKVAIPGQASGALLSQGSDWFNFNGIQWIRWGGVVNTSSGTFTNLSANIVLSQPDSHR